MVQQEEACCRRVGGEEAFQAVEDVDLVVVAYMAHDSGNQDQIVKPYQVVDHEEGNVLAAEYNIALAVGLQVGS